MAEEDLIFGKKRHFFGGIEPSNMLGFTAESVREGLTTRVKLLATLPNDTIVEDQLLCTVAGAVIVRKQDGVPTDEFDGDLVAEITTSGVYYDEDVEEDATYTYAAFPYTTQGVYNRNPANASTVTVAGAVPPLPVTSFTATSTFVNGNPRIRVEIHHPGDTIEDGVAVSTLAGIIIRRSKDAYPLDETQGVTVMHIKSSDLGTNNAVDTSFYDATVEINTTYYYSAFPYNVEGLYNRDPKNRASAHVDAGSPPANLTYFKATSTAVLEDPVIVLDVNLPNPPEAGSKVQATIRRKTGGYPTSETDGDLITTFYDTDKLCYNSLNDTTGHLRYYDYSVVDGVTYYYRAFVMTDKGAINKNDITIHKQSVEAKAEWTFGFVVNGSVTNPQQNVFYDFTTSGFGISPSYDWPSGKQPDNLDFTPAKMDYANDKFNYGSWGDIIPGTLFMPRPCILNMDGTVRAYLNPNDYTKDEFGDPVDITDAGLAFSGNVMMEFPCMYAKSVYGDASTSNGTNYGGNGWTYYCNLRRPTTTGLGVAFPYNFAERIGSGDDISYKAYKHLYYSVYDNVKKTTGGKSVYQSISGATPTTNAISQASTMVSDCKNKVQSGSIVADSTGSWGIGSFLDDAYVAGLAVLISKSTDSQNAFGYGISSSSGNGATGTLDSKGMFYGQKNGGAVKIFGIENFYGRLGRFAPGTNLLFSKYTMGGGSNPAYWYRLVHCLARTRENTSLLVSGTNPDVEGGYITQLLYKYHDNYTGDIAPTNAEIGNGYSAYMDGNAGCLWAQFQKASNPDTNYGNALRGSATTGLCDYVRKTDNIPTDYSYRGKYESQTSGYYSAWDYTQSLIAIYGKGSGSEMGIFGIDYLSKTNTTQTCCRVSYAKDLT